MLELQTPAGIGDICWIYQKIAELAGQRAVGLASADWPPPRSLPFLDKLPGVENLGSCDWPKFPAGAISHETNLADLPDGTYRIEANTALERGRRLETIWPKQPTLWHFQPTISEESRAEARALIGTIDAEPRIGIYCSADQNDRLWSLTTWLWLVEQLRLRYPGAGFYMIGASYDIKTFQLFDLLSLEEFNATSAVGQFEIGSTLALIDELDYFVSYPSGLGIMAGVLGTPCLMYLWRDFPEAFHYSYADPEDVESGRHLNIKADEIERSLRLFDARGAEHLTQRIRDRRRDRSPQTDRSEAVHV